MKIKTSELTGAALDWAVAKAECFDCYLDMRGSGDWVAFVDFSEHTHIHYTPSEHWGFGGPIVEREKMGVWWATHVVDDEGNEYGNHWYAEPGMTDENADKPYTCMTGPTPLIAAMRCYVVSHLGEEVEIPKELE